MKLRSLFPLPVKICSIVVLAALTACAQPPVPQDHFYRLNLPSKSKLSGPKFNGTVEVERFVANGLAESRPILFTASATATEIQAYHYHFWTEPPSIMLQNAVTSKLRQANIAKSIVTPNLRIEPDYILAGKILRFEQILGSDDKVSISLELSLKQAKLDKLLHLDTYSIEVLSQNASVAAAVAAFSTGVDKVLSAFLKDLNGKI